MEYTKTDLQNYSKYLIEVADKHDIKKNMNTYCMLKNYSKTCKFWKNTNTWNSEKEKSIKDDLEVFDIIRFNFEEWYVKTTKIDNFYSWLESRKWKLII